MLKKGDKVTIIDGSYAICITESKENDTETHLHPALVAQRDEFIFVKSIWSHEKGIHDIIIKNTKTKNRFLHSSRYVLKNWFNGASIGDTFKIDEQFYILAQCEKMKIVLINLLTGARFSDAIICEDPDEITCTEFVLTTGLPDEESAEEIYKNKTD